MATLTWALLFVVPYAILTAAGVLLWKRWRSFATFLVALGFAAALVGQGRRAVHKPRIQRGHAYSSTRVSS